MQTFTIECTAETGHIAIGLYRVTTELAKNCIKAFYSVSIYNQSQTCQTWWDIIEGTKMGKVESTELSLHVDFQIKAQKIQWYRSHLETSPPVYCQFICNDV
jgi:hypothetical protein